MRRASEQWGKILAEVKLMITNKAYGLVSKQDMLLHENLKVVLLHNLQFLGFCKQGFLLTKETCFYQQPYKMLAVKIPGSSNISESEIK